MSVIRGYYVPRWAYWTIMKVACPESYCRAAATWPCTSKSGKISATPHVSRSTAYQESDHGKARNRPG